MDDHPDDAREPRGGQPPEAQFRPDGRITALAAGGLVVAVVAALITEDPEGRLLAAVAAVLLALYVLGDLVFRPRLVVNRLGIAIRSPFTRVSLAWDEIDDVRADARTRLGRRNTALEIDAGSVLAVLTRRALGADPEEVADLIRAFRPA